MKSLFKTAAKVVAIESLNSNSNINLNTIPINCKEEVNQTKNKLLDYIFYDGDEWLKSQFIEYIESGVHEIPMKFNQYKQEKIDEWINQYKKNIETIRFEFELYGNN